MKRPILKSVAQIIKIGRRKILNRMNAQIVKSTLIILAQFIDERNIITFFSLFGTKRIPRGLLAAALEKRGRLFASQHLFNPIFCKMEIVKKVIHHKRSFLAIGIDYISISRQNAL